MPEVRHFFALALAALASSGDVRTIAARGPELSFSPAPITLVEDPPPPSPPASAAWALSLPALRFHNVNTEKDGTFRLYTPDGAFDEAAAAELDRVLAPRD